MKFGIKSAILSKKYLMANLGAKQYLEIKIKSYGGNVKTDFND